MANDQTPQQKDFFISYTGKDSQWVQWIAFELEATDYTTQIRRFRQCSIISSATPQP